MLLLWCGGHCSTFPFGYLFLKFVNVFLILFHFFGNSGLLLPALHFCHKLVFFIRECLKPYLFDIAKHLWGGARSLRELFIHGPCKGRGLTIDILFKGLTPGFLRFFLLLFFRSFSLILLFRSFFCWLLILFLIKLGLSKILLCLLLLSIWLYLLILLLTSRLFTSLLFFLFGSCLSPLFQQRREWVKWWLSAVDVFFGVLFLDLVIVRLE